MRREHKVTKKKIFDLTAGVVLIALSVPANAQDARKVPRIGFLLPASLSAVSVRTEAFRQGL